MNKLFLALPCYGGQMHATCTLSILDLDRICRERGIGIEYQMILNESLISRGRNFLVNEFMKSNCTHLLFVDSDIQFNAQDIIKMIEADKDIIGGVYSKKELLWERIHQSANNGVDANNLQYHTSGIVFIPLPDLNDKIHKLDNPLEVKYIGTGLMLINRNVFDKMKEAYPDRTYDYKGELHYCYFDCIIKDNSYLSEDYYFCDRWRELGGKIFAAMWTKTTHYGNLGLNTNIELL